MRLALQSGFVHPDRLWAVLSARQVREIEIYARIEPIGGMTGVSEPPKPGPDRAGIFAGIKAMFEKKAEAN